MKDTLRLVVVLTAICLVCSSVLAYVHGITKDPIARALEKKTIEAAKSVMPAGAPSPEKRTAKIGDEEISYFVSEKDGKPLATAIEGISHNGYGGDIRLMVGLGADGKLVSFEVVQAAETPGLGMKLTDDSFRKPLAGHPLESEWRVTKDGGDVVPITAATITSRAVAECIRDAVAKQKRICLP